MVDDDDMIETADLPQGQAALNGPPASAKLWLRVVYIMSIILVLLFLALIGGIIWKATQRTPPPVGPAAPITDLGLAPGTTVQSMQLDGDRLAINTGTEIIIVDFRKNTIISRITTNAK